MGTMLSPIATQENELKEVEAVRNRVLYSSNILSLVGSTVPTLATRNRLQSGSRRDPISNFVDSSHSPLCFAVPSTLHKESSTRSIFHPEIGNIFLEHSPTRVQQGFPRKQPEELNWRSTLRDSKLERRIALLKDCESNLTSNRNTSSCVFASCAIVFALLRESATNSILKRNISFADSANLPKNGAQHEYFEKQAVHSVVSGLDSGDPRRCQDLQSGAGHIRTRRVVRHLKAVCKRTAKKV